MTPEAMARLHARAFTDGSRPWSAAEFAALVEADAFAVARPEGFARGRAAAREAELLTLAVAPEVRRRGIGRGLLAAFEAEARYRGAAEAFLEVAETNAAARGLYAATGYVEVGRRRGYVARDTGGADDALVLRRWLRA